jgi:cytochrome c oxidase assembly protein Cox11
MTDQNGTVTPGAVVVRYSGITHLDSVTTDASGVASWTGIEAGTYVFEIYVTGGLWSRGSVKVVAGTTNVTFHRSEPYVTGVRIFNAITNVEVLNGVVSAGTPLRFQVTVRNPNTAGRAVFVQLTLDVDKDDPLDFIQASGTQSIGGGAVKTYTFNYTPMLGGQWYMRVEAKTLIGGKAVDTDFENWSSLFAASPGVADLNVTVKDETGATRSGAEVLRYQVLGGFIDRKTTGANGVASWSGTASKEYVLEAYYNGAFWARTVVEVPLGSVTNVTIRRNWPLATQFKVFNANTNADVTFGAVSTGTPLRFEITVHNINPASQTVNVTLKVDRDKLVPLDFAQTSAPQVMASGATATFTFTYAPVLSGPWFGRVEVNSAYGNFVITDVIDWNTIVTVASSPANLNVTVLNESGAKVAGAVVLRYSSGGSFIDQRTTDASGVASWSGISSTGYRLEAYFNNAFWAKGSVDVPAGSTKGVTLRRSEPLAYEFKIFNASTNANVTNGSVAAGTPLRATIKVRNVNTAARTVQVKFTLDLDKDTPFDFSATSADQTITSGGSATYTFNVTPFVGGLLFRVVEVDTQLDGVFTPTDISGWVSTVTVVPSIGDLNVTVKDQNGATVAGAVVVRYTFGGSVIDQKTTNSSGVASWTGIPSEEFRLEAYVKTAFWVDGVVSVGALTTTNIVLQRDEPYVSDFRVFNAITNADVTDSFVAAGTSLRIEITVRNGNVEDRTVRVSLFVDRNKNSPYDFSQMSAEQAVSAGGTAKLIFSFKPSSSDEYFFKTVTEAFLHGAFAITDLPDWAPLFRAVSKPPLMISGLVLASDGEPMEDVVVRALSNDGVTVVAEDTTNADGEYTLVVPRNWSGSVFVAEFPDFLGFTFYPGLRNFSKIQGDQVEQDFVGYAPVMISGRVRLQNSTPVGGVVVTASNGGGRSTTYVDGTYSLMVPGGPDGWTGVVTPTAAGYAFAPVYRYYSGISTAQTGQDYTAYSGEAIDHLAVTGPATVKEGMSADYTCTAYYTGGRSADVTRVAAWQVSSSSAAIDANGHFTTKSITSDKDVNITASYGGAQVTLNVTIVHVTSLAISGPVEVHGGSGADYTCTATFSDGSTADVTNLAQWSEDSSHASINNAGYLTTTSVTTNKTVHVKAKFGGKSKTFTATITP